MQQDASPQTEKLWRRYLSNYMGALRMIDDQVKRLLGQLDLRNLSKNTLIIFTSDHGDSLMNYGIGHKGSMCTRRSRTFRRSGTTSA